MAKYLIKLKNDSQAIIRQWKNWN